MSHSHILSPADAKNFIFAGKSTVTFLSKSGTRYTYKVSKLKEEKKTPGTENDLFFVSVMTGPDNERSYSYMGTVFVSPEGSKTFKLTRGSKLSGEDKRVKAFVYVMYHLYKGTLEGVEIYHEGRCGRCGKKLTVPESILNGIGPECLKMMR